jgi:hypothetical protein
MSGIGPSAFERLLQLPSVGKHNLSDRAIEQRQEPRDKARTTNIFRVSENGMFAAGHDGRGA